jgi:hypothetical protein
MVLPKTISRLDAQEVQELPIGRMKWPTGVGKSGIRKDFHLYSFGAPVKYIAGRCRLGCLLFSKMLTGAPIKFGCCYV